MDHRLFTLPSILSGVGSMACAVTYVVTAGVIIAGPRSGTLIGNPWLGYGSLFLAILTVVLLLVRGHRIRQADDRVRRGLCRRCGYDIRATRDRCPECGAAPAIE